MADNILEAPVQEQPAIDINRQELDKQMAISLGLSAPPTVEDPVIEGNNNGQSTAVNQEQSAAAQTETIPEFKFDTFKNEFGYEKPEDIAAEIKQLRAFKATPQTAAELKFENDQSKLLFEALKAGKTKEVYTYLAEQERLDRFSALEITQDTAPDIIKAGFQLKYKGLSPEMVEHKFNKTFGIPKEPVQYADEEIEDFKVRTDEWKSAVKDVQMERLIEANLIKPDLEAAKTKLLMPEIPQNVDQGYLDWKQGQEEMKSVNAEVFEAYKKFIPTDIKTKVPYIDEANKVNFEFEYVPDEKGFKESQESVTDLDKFFARFKNSDGSPNRKGFFAAIDFSINKDKIISAAIKQGITAYIKGQLPDNNPDGTSRQVVTQIGEESELDKQMRLAGVKKG